MAKYYLSLLIKNKSGNITEEHKKLCASSPNFKSIKSIDPDGKEYTRIYYDIPLEPILGHQVNSLEHLGHFTMRFKNGIELKQFLIEKNLMPLELADKRMNIYTAYKGERFGLEAGIPYVKTKQYLNPTEIKQYFLKHFDDNKFAYFYPRGLEPLPVDYKVFTRLIEMLESRYSRGNYSGSKKDLDLVERLVTTMMRKQRVGHFVNDARKSLINVLNRELYIKSDSNEGINYHGLFVLANSRIIHEKWLKKENERAFCDMYNNVPFPTDYDAPIVDEAGGLPIFEENELNEILSEKPTINSNNIEKNELYISQRVIDDEIEEIKEKAKRKSLTLKPQQLSFFDK